MSNVSDLNTLLSIHSGKPIMSISVLRRGIIAILIGSLVGSTTAADDASAGDWPQWRGPTRDGHAVGESWPNSLGDDRLKLAWRVELGPSYSGPVVAGDRVFTTETSEQKTEVVSAYDRRTGDRLWSTNWPGAMNVPFFAASNGSWIRATPACDGESLFVAGMREVLVALDVVTGNERWSVDFTQEFGTPLPAFGFASSPMVYGGALYVQAGSGFVKLDKRSGDVIWRTAIDDNDMSSSAFSSPFLATIADKPLALVQTRLALKGIAPDSGEEQWSQSIEAFRGMNILTPTVYNGAVFTSAHTGRSQLWQLANTEPVDTKSGGLKQIWSNKSQAYMSSPVIVGDYLYMHLRNQRIQCVDLKTGKEAWRTQPFGKYQSMVVLGDRILALDQRGELILFSADPTEFVKIDSRKISDEDTWAHVAVCGGHIFVRESGALAAYVWQ
jgi:outer membrane protein assembly factor BamB